MTICDQDKRKMSSMEIKGEFFGLAEGIFICYTSVYMCACVCMCVFN